MLKPYYYYSFLFLIFSICNFSCTTTTPNAKLTNEIDAFCKEIEKITTSYEVSNYKYALLNNGDLINCNSEGSLDLINKNDYKSNLILLTCSLNKLIQQNKVDPYQPINEQIKAIDSHIPTLLLQDFIFSTSETMPSMYFTTDSVSKLLKEIITKAGKYSVINKGVSFNQFVKLIGKEFSTYPLSNSGQDKIPNPFKKLIKYYMGCNIQQYYEHSIFWNFSKYENSNLLVITVYPEQISLVVSYESDHIPNPNYFNDHNILKNPFTLALLKSFCLNNYPEMDLKNIDDSVLSKIHYSAAKDKELFMYELILEDLLCANVQRDSIVRRKIKHTFNRVFSTEIPLELSTKPCIAAINQVTDNTLWRKTFEISEKKTVRILSKGEGVCKKGFYYPDWENDNVQVFFDLNNRKSDQFDIYDNDFQYIVCYGLDHIFGNFISKKDIQIKQSEPSDSVYLMEMKFPWQTLGISNPSEGFVFGFDLQVNDNDGDRFKGSIAWNSSPDRAHRSTVEYGNISLSKNNLGDSSNLISLKTKKPPKIDGKIDGSWLIARKNKFKYRLNYKNKTDLAASFRTLWDKDNFYVLIEIVDDVKNQPWTINALRDYGWIETISGDIVWKMDARKVKTSAVCDIVKEVDTTILLLPGKYNLFFISDFGNSYSNFYCKGYNSSFYGISLFEN